MNGKAKKQLKKSTIYSTNNLKPNYNTKQNSRIILNIHHMHVIMSFQMTEELANDILKFE